VKAIAGTLLVIGMAVAIVGCGAKEEVAPSTPQTVGNAGAPQTLGNPPVAGGGAAAPTTR